MSWAMSRPNNYLYQSAWDSWLRRHNYWHSSDWWIGHNGAKNYQKSPYLLIKIFMLLHNFSSYDFFIFKILFTYQNLNLKTEKKYGMLHKQKSRHVIRLIGQLQVCRNRGWRGPIPPPDFVRNRSKTFCFKRPSITKVLFTDRYIWQNFALQFLGPVNRLYSVIHKTQKS